MKKQTAKKSVKVSRSTHMHKKHSQKFLKVYWPYIPLFILVFTGLTFGYNWGGKTTSFGSSGVLSYATEMSISGLLSNTNAQRANNGGLAALTLNSKLSSAAQAKANDMVARDYWSHNTPDGKEPWVFIDAAGYDYTKAGENLAYGFANSNDTVIGWMNSPGHRANILDVSYKEVGFGFANSASYVGTGEETIVVAMYGTPTNSTVQVNTTTTSTAPAVKAAPTRSSNNTPQPVIQDTVVPAQPVQTQAPTPKKLAADRINQAVTSESPLPASQPTTRITKLQSLTGGKAPWSAAVLSVSVLAVVGLWTLKHAFIVKKVLVDGEEFLLHHPIIDVSVLVLVSIAILLSRSSGVVK